LIYPLFECVLLLHKALRALHGAVLCVVPQSGTLIAGTMIGWV
jgi:hypothetical protein